MGMFTIKGSAAFDERLQRDFDRIAETLGTSPYIDRLRALVLIGGYGRGEGTPRITARGQEPFNDYDLVVVSVPMNRRRRHIVQSHLRLMEQQLSRELHLPVDLQLYPLNELRRAEFSLLNCEMKYGHKVVWGDPRILDAMPSYPRGRIPLSEGTRLLLNRGKLLLDCRRALRTGRTLDADERLRFVKFLFKAQLAFGDCALLTAGGYDLSYRVKLDRIGKAILPGVPDAAFLVDRFRAAVTLKEWGDYSFLPDYPLADEFEIIRRYYLRFLQWYESRRAAPDETARTARSDARFTSPDEAPAWKTAALNVQAFGLPAAAQGTALWRRHPRLRLYRALPLLLADEPVDAGALARLFQMSASGREEAEKRFYQLQKRFS